MRHANAVPLHLQHPMHVAPKVQPPATSWWLSVPRERWTQTVEAQLPRWTCSPQAAALVPTASVPILAQPRPRRGPLA